MADQQRQFSIGESVVHTDGDEKRRGTVCECDVAVPEGAEDKRHHHFYRVEFGDGGSAVLAECDLAPSDAPARDD